jgi:hypothetical protein
MGLQESLQRAKENATGAVGGAIGSLLSLPHATLAGLAAAIDGESPGDAASTIVDTYARNGEAIGRASADIIFGVLTEAAREAALEQARKQRELNR